MTTVNAFFYGLFMDTSLLEKQGIGVRSCQPARLDGYALVIGQRPTLEKSATKQVHGMLMSLADNDLRRLYSEPSVAEYVRARVSVKPAHDRPAPAICYILPAARSRGRNPEYATALATLAEESGLPRGYISEIESWAKRA